MVVTEKEAHVPGKETSRSQYRRVHSHPHAPHPHPPKQKLHPFFSPNAEHGFPPLFPLSQLSPWLPPQNIYLLGFFILFKPFSHNFPMKGSFAKQAEAFHFPAETLKIYLPSSQTRYTSESCKNTKTVE